MVPRMMTIATIPPPPETDIPRPTRTDARMRRAIALPPNRNLDGVFANAKRKCQASLRISDGKAPTLVNGWHGDSPFRWRRHGFKG